MTITHLESKEHNKFRLNLRFCIFPVDVGMDHTLSTGEVSFRQTL